jgi:hypothetical protein
VAAAPAISIAATGTIHFMAKPFPFSKTNVSRLRDGLIAEAGADSRLFRSDQTPMGSESRVARMVGSMLGALFPVDAASARRRSSRNAARPDLPPRPTPG